MQTNATYTSLVAIGDSFTEGMSDRLPDGSYRGWADLLAARLAERTPVSATPTSPYAGSSSARSSRTRWTPPPR